MDIDPLFPLEIWDRIIWYMVNDGNEVPTETPTLGLFKKIMEKCRVSSRWLFLVREWISIDSFLWHKLDLKHLALLKPATIPIGFDGILGSLDLCNLRSLELNGSLHSYTFERRIFTQLTHLYSSSGYLGNYELTLLTNLTSLKLDTTKLITHDFPVTTLANLSTLIVKGGGPFNMKNIVTWGKLTRLDLCGCLGMNSGDLLYLTNLTDLRLKDQNRFAEGVLCGMTQLRILSIIDCSRITGTCFQDLPNLTKLKFSGSILSDHSIYYLTGLTSLSIMHNNQITLDSMPFFLTNLKALKLHSTRVTTRCLIGNGLISFSCDDQFHLTCNACERLENLTKLSVVGTTNSRGTSHSAYAIQLLTNLQKLKFCSQSLLLSSQSIEFLTKLKYITVSKFDRYSVDEYLSFVSSIEKKKRRDKLFNGFLNLQVGTDREEKSYTLNQ